METKNTSGSATKSQQVAETTTKNNPPGDTEEEEGPPLPEDRLEGRDSVEARLAAWFEKSEWPLRLTQIKAKGYGMTASSDIEHGQVVMSCPPYVFVPYETRKKNVCAYCFKMFKPDPENVDKSQDIQNKPAKKLPDLPNTDSQTGSKDVTANKDNTSKESSKEEPTQPKNENTSSDNIDKGITTKEDIKEPLASDKDNKDKTDDTNKGDNAVKVAGSDSVTSEKETNKTDNTNKGDNVVKVAGSDSVPSENKTDNTNKGDNAVKVAGSASVPSDTVKSSMADNKEGANNTSNTKVDADAEDDDNDTDNDDADTDDTDDSDDDEIEEFRPDESRPCSHCAQVWYCSEHCQNLDLEEHSNYECLALKNLDVKWAKDYYQYCDDLITDVRLLIRALNKRQVSIDVQPEEADLDDFTEQYGHLISNKECYSQDVLLSLRGVAQLVNYLMPEEAQIEEDELLDIYCKHRVNMFGIWGDAGECLGYGVYPRASFFNHSCWPNVTFYKNKTKRSPYLDFVTVYAIPKDTEVCISYIDISEGLKPRRHTLKDKYFFHCECDRCSYQEMNPDALDPYYDPQYYTDDNEEDQKKNQNPDNKKKKERFQK